MTTKLSGERTPGSRRCQDCGNQAKRSCGYLRCRSCCKNKGFECESHVKSTWVPVDLRRRHRDEEDHRLHDDDDISKRHKHNPFPGRDVEKWKFPASVSQTATFQCVHVRSMDDSVKEYAYHTSVNVGGHVFRGLLYGESSSSGQYHLLPHHNNHLINATTQTHIDDESGFRIPHHPSDGVKKFNTMQYSSGSQLIDDGTATLMAPMLSSSAANNSVDHFIFSPTYSSFPLAATNVSHPKP